MNCNKCRCELKHTETFMCEECLKTNIAGMTGMPCEYCGNINAQYIADPFDAEINDEINMMWLCEACEQERRDEI